MSGMPPFFFDIGATLPVGSQALIEDNIAHFKEPSMGTVFRLSQETVSRCRPTYHHTH